MSASLEFVKGSCVLLLDAAPATAAPLAQGLKARGCQTLEAASVEDARTLLASEPVDLVVLDMDLGGGGGGDLLRELRNASSRAELPVMALTGDRRRDAALRLIDDGANDCMARPVDHELLLARIGVQLQIRDALRRAQTEQARLQRRLQAGARPDDHGHGEGKKRRLMMDELQRDLEQNKLTLHYQPKYRIRQGVIDSAEALVRWTSETFGAVSPGQFIPMAEETGEIGPLTDWSIKQALNDQARLAAAGYPLKVAVNLSATLVCDDAFTNRILDLVGPRTQAILLELTESAVFGNGERAIANLQRLADAGIQIAIDDYGTGMSSLAYLQKLPIRELKIDRMFISNLTRSHRDPLLVRSTIDLARALEIEVVAEGIEDAATLALLRVMGCDVAQGYFIARPMALERLIAYLAEKPAEKLNTPLDAKAFLASAIR